MESSPPPADPNTAWRRAGGSAALAAAAVAAARAPLPSRRRFSAALALRSPAGGGPRRRELYVTSKLWPSDHARVREACLGSLRALRLDRLDLYLLHWPPSDDGSLERLWRCMESLVAEGLATSIGVCNCSARRLDALFALRPAVAPAVNQVEVHPGWRNEAPSRGGRAGRAGLDFERDNRLLRAARSVLQPC